MTVVVAALAVAAWLGCGVWATAWVRRYFWDQYPTLRDDPPFPMAFVLLGPVGLLAALINCGLPNRTRKSGQQQLLLGSRRKAKK